LKDDISAIGNSGAAAVVTLVEQEEMDRLSVTSLGPEVIGAHMEWHHLPIRDVSVPCGRFEQQWSRVSPGLRARLRDGFPVVVHCRGGLGRAGMVAARLLTELGADPHEAIRLVREVRPGAIETEAQARHVVQQKSVAEPEPDRRPRRTAPWVLSSAWQSVMRSAQP
jgi:ADP-ribosyl-[dinitrogen reductase] hydrolase